MINSGPPPPPPAPPPPPPAEPNEEDALLRERARNRRGRSSLRISGGAADTSNTGLRIPK